MKKKNFTVIYTYTICFMLETTTEKSPIINYLKITLKLSMTEDI